MQLPLFVYGTLGSAFQNRWARRLWDGKRPLGAARIRGRLFLLDGYPGLTPPRGQSEWVRGELVNPRGLLRWLDCYEGPCFRRCMRRVVTGKGETLRAWVYLYTGPPPAGCRIWTGSFNTATRFASRRA